jgi:hypothetical protein
LLEAGVSMGLTEFIDPVAEQALKKILIKSRDGKKRNGNFIRVSLQNTIFTKDTPLPREKFHFKILEPFYFSTR